MAPRAKPTRTTYGTSAPALTRILQWNCRCLNHRRAELNQRNLDDGDDRPLAFLLQEVNGNKFNLTGYACHTRPTILHKRRGRRRDGQDAAIEARGQAAIYIARYHPHVGIDTSKWCDQEQEVVAVRTELQGTRYLLVSYYARPGQTATNLEWIGQLRRQYPKDQVLIGGDFNAWHTAWDYGNDTKRGTHLLAAMLAEDLQLLNEPGRPTRVGQSPREANTTPDLTWTTRGSRARWRLVDDTMGSDHYPVEIEIPSAKNTTHAKRTDKITYWDDFRSALEELEAPADLPQLMRDIQTAKEEATFEVQVREDAPKPDMHLLNLWQSRLEALQNFRSGGKTPKLRRVLNAATKKAKDYSTQLGLERWRNLCDGFNENMQAPQVWNVLRGMQGNRKTRTAAQNVALHLDETDEQVAVEAGRLFFPQPARKDEDLMLDKNDDAPPPPSPALSAEDDADEYEADRPFTLDELEAAMAESNVRSAPGPDGVTYAALRNLPEKHKRLLLNHVNKVWETASLPLDWKASIVVPIPKAGKPLTEVGNLRPISLTSNICKLAERMLLYRVQWHLETQGRLHHCQVGFRPGMSTQDVMMRIYEDVLKEPSRVQPRTVVGVDVKKAFDTVPHRSVIESARALGVRGRALEFIKNFLRDRTYKVKVGKALGPENRNFIGVPQGAVLSPTLFNMVMARLPEKLERVKDLKFAIYADDITLWSTRGSVGEQERTIQDGLDAVQVFLEEVGMRASSEKTEYVVVLAGKKREANATRNAFHLTLDGQTILRKPSIRILGHLIDEDGKAQTWFEKTRKTCTQLLHLIRRLTNRRWGTREAETRQIVQALIVSRIMYGFVYYNLTKMQKNGLEKINREAIRIITGLPRYTLTEDLYRYGNLNQLVDREDLHKAAQIDRLRASEAGRKLLQEMGYSNEGLAPLPRVLPPWDRIAITDDKPIPKNVGYAHPKRRRAMAELHEMAAQGYRPCTRYVYVDAAKTEDATSVAWYDADTNHTEAHEIHPNMTVKGAELEALLNAAKYSSDTLRDEDEEIHIFTDSRQAFAECKSRHSRSRKVRAIRDVARGLAKKGVKIKISWIPAHTGISGNEKANTAAREKIRHTPVHNAKSREEEDADPRDDDDPDEVSTRAKQERKRHLRVRRNPDDDYIPLPNEYGRKKQVYIRLLQTNTALTPTRRALFNKEKGPSAGKCADCGVPASAEHLIWTCPTYDGPRHVALSSLPPDLRPSSYTEWIHPGHRTPAHRKAVWNSLLSFVAENESLQADVFGNVRSSTDVRRQE